MEVNVEISGMEEYVKAVANVKNAIAELRRALGILEQTFEEKYSVKMPPSEDGSENVRELF